MKNFLKYLGLGLLFSLNVESINMGILQGNWIGMLQTILLVYSVFIVIGFTLQKGLSNKRSAKVIHFVINGFIGLVIIEWWLIGTPPSADQTLLTVILFQLGIFIYWATVGFAPRMLLDNHTDSRKIASRFVKFYLIWFLIVYIIGLSLLDGSARFGFMQVFSALGHIILLVFYLPYFRIRENM